MPNIKSAKKRAELSATFREANRAKRSALRTALRKVSTSLSAKPEEARAALVSAAKALDKAAAAGLIHKNTAARKKSRLTRKVNAMKIK